MGFLQVEYISCHPTNSIKPEGKGTIKLPKKISGD